MNTIFVVVVTLVLTCFVATGAAANDPEAGPRGGSLRGLHLGDSVADYQALFSDDVHEHREFEHWYGYEAKPLEPTGDYVMQHLAVFFDRDRRLYEVFYKVTLPRIVPLEEMLGNLTEAFGPPSETTSGDPMAERPADATAQLLWKAAAARLQLDVQWLSFLKWTMIEIRLVDEQAKAATMKLADEEVAARRNNTKLPF